MGLGDVQPVKTGSFPRTRLCRNGAHSFLEGTDNLVCSMCGHIEPRVKLHG